jgi:hypothetical protein
MSGTTGDDQPAGGIRASDAERDATVERRDWRAERRAERRSAR